VACTEGPTQGGVNCESHPAGCAATSCEPVLGLHLRAVVTVELHRANAADTASASASALPRHMRMAMACTHCRRYVSSHLPCRAQYAGGTLASVALRTLLGESIVAPQWGLLMFPVEVLAVRTRRWDCRSSIKLGLVMVKLYENVVLDTGQQQHRQQQMLLQHPHCGRFPSPRQSVSQSASQSVQYNAL
jgi:hypothetical protein